MQPLSFLFTVSRAARDRILQEFSSCPGAEDEALDFRVKISGLSWHIVLYLVNNEILVDTFLHSPVNHCYRLREFIGKRITEAVPVW